mgnify:FL=1
MSKCFKFGDLKLTDQDHAVNQRAAMSSARRNAKRWIVNEQVATATMIWRKNELQVRVSDESATGCQVKFEKFIPLREGEKVRLVRQNCERIYEVRRIERASKGMVVGMRYVAEVVHNDYDAQISAALGTNVVMLEDRRPAFQKTIAVLAVVAVAGLVVGGFFVMSREKDDDLLASLWGAAESYRESGTNGTAGMVKPVSLINLQAGLAVRQREVQDELSPDPEVDGTGELAGMEDHFPATGGDPKGACGGVAGFGGSANSNVSTRISSAFAKRSARLDSRVKTNEPLRPLRSLRK